MSFLDPPDEPARRSSRRGGGGLDPADQRTLLIRRGIAFGAGALIVILLVLLVDSCNDARTDRAYQDYVRDVTALMDASKQQSDGLFGLLREPGDQTAVDVQNSINGFRVQAEQLVERAQKLDHPGGVDTAHGFLVQTLELRRDGLAEIADELPGALGDEGNREASELIAGDMQLFLASDAIFTTRVIPGVQEELRKRELLGQAELRPSPFLPDIDWLRTATVATRIGAIREGGGDAGEAATPGVHGLGLGSVTVAGEALTDGAPAQVPLTDPLVVSVGVENQGESEESDITVEVAVGDGAPVERTIESLAAGASESVEIPLTEAPPAGQQVTLTVRVAPVPGEKVSDNNEASFPVTFSQG